MNSTYWLNKVMTDTYTNGGPFYLGLSSTNPTAAGANISEPSGGGYARVAVGSFSSPVAGSVSNTAKITFPQSTATWFDAYHKATYWVLFDGSGSSAHFLASGLLEESRSIESKTTISVNAGALTVTLQDSTS